MNATSLLTSLPDGWRRVPLKTTCDFAVSNVDKHSFDDELPVRLCNYTDVYKNDRVSPDLDLMAATATQQEIERFHLEIGDVVITKDSESWDDIGIPAYVEGTADDFVCGYHLAFIRPRKEVIDGRFLFRCIQSRPVALQLELEATGVTRYGLPKDAIGLAVLPLPPLTTQAVIANYLDRETARIDALIAEKERMLALLEEKRAALISRVVTRGLDPNAPLKPSGQEWLGEIPAHWEIRKLKYVVSKIGSGVTPKGGAESYQTDGIPLLRSQNIHFGGLRMDDVVFIDAETHESMFNSKVLGGDVLINITGASIGRCFYVENINSEANVNQHVCIVRPSKQIQTKYLYFTLRSDIGQHQIDLSQSGSGREGLNFESLGNFSIPVPPPNEQIAITENLEKSGQRTSELLGEIRSSINRLKERRAALITAAVTGKIDIEQMKKNDRRTP